MFGGSEGGGIVIQLCLTNYSFIYDLFVGDMAELINCLDHAFLENECIEELGLIMQSPPPSVTVVDNKIGISVHVLKLLFTHAIEELNNLMPSLKNCCMLQYDDLRAMKIASLSRAALIVRGDTPYVLNMRKSLIIQGKLSPLKELLFLSMIFTQHPKSSSGWYHRRFCLSNLPYSAESFKSELELCNRMSDQYPKNYYSWLHRLWILQFLSIAQASKINLSGVPNYFHFILFSFRSYKLSWIPIMNGCCLMSPTIAL